MMSHTDKKDADLIVGYTNYDPEGHPVYHPAIAKLAAIWAIVLGAVLGWLAYMIASGTWPIRDFGQFSSADNAVATFVGVSVGLALGGLIGALMGLHKMLKSRKI